MRHPTWEQVRGDIRETHPLSTGTSKGLKAKYYPCDMSMCWNLNSRNKGKNNLKSVSSVMFLVEKL